MIAHFIQWWIMGTTVSPIEPSETMYTLQRGAINAGLIFFSLAILATLIFGRFVCGWGCHIVALQDFCAWLLKKVGLVPKAISVAAAGLCSAHRRSLYVRLADSFASLHETGRRTADSGIHQSSGHEQFLGNFPDRRSRHPFSFHLRFHDRLFSGIRKAFAPTPALMAGSSVSLTSSRPEKFALPTRAINVATARRPALRTFSSTQR